MGREYTLMILIVGFVYRNYESIEFIDVSAFISILLWQGYKEKGCWPYVYKELSIPYRLRKAF